MTTAKHTPSPWTVHSFIHPSTDGAFDPTDAGMYEIEEANEQIVGELKLGNFAEAEAIGLANARLIEAAPALLVACEDMLSRFSGDIAVMDLVRAAIAQARGGS